MAGIAFKTLAGLATAGAIGGSIYGGIYAYNNATTDTLENYLTNNGFTLIKAGESEKWTKVLEAYKLEKKATDPTETEATIKIWCNSTLKKTIKSKEEADYEKATKLCVNFDNIKDKLGSKKLEGTESKLTSKLANFPEAIKKEVEAIKEAQDPNKAGKQIKKWCENNVKRRYLSDAEDYYKSINDHCLVAS